MKKILIMTLNSKYIHASLSPWCLKAGVEAFCPHPVEILVLDATINQNIQEVAEKILALDICALGISCYIWNIAQSKTLANILKTHRPELPLLMGGPEVSFDPELLLQECPFVDFVLGGEGELPFAQWVTRILEGKEDFTGIEGLSFVHQGHMITSPPYLTKEVPPSPYCQAYFDQLQGKIAYMQSSRGCPYGCAFCLSGKGEAHRYYPLDRVEQELVALANSGTQTVKFVDRTFNSKASHCDHILSFLLLEYGKSIPTHLCFHFEMAGDILKQSTLDLLSKMPKGYVQIEIGMQSFCEKTLEAVGRKTNIPLLLANLQTLVAMDNHHLHIDLIAGLPLEDLEEFGKSFNIAYDIGADMLQLGFLKVLKGSEIGENPQKYLEDYHKTPPYQVISTPWMGEADFSLLEKIEDAVDKIYNSGRFEDCLAYVKEATKWDAFALFRQLGQGLWEQKGSLEGYVDALFALCCDFPGVEREKLRDFLVLDRVSTNSTGILPQSLKIQDENLRKLTILLEQNPQTKRSPQGKRFVGILYSQNTGIYVDYPLKKGKNKHNREKFVVHSVSLDLLSQD